MKRIRVPEGVIEAGVSAVRSYCAAHGYVGDDGHISDAWLGVVPEVVGAVLRHLSEHPQVPTDEQANALLNSLYPTGVKYWSQLMWSGFIQMTCEEWQRRCFQEEEPEIEKDLSDLTIAFDVSHKVGKLAIDAIQEAYRRGLRKGEQK